jgi:hypothetical protein
MPVNVVTLPIHPHNRLGMRSEPRGGSVYASATPHLVSQDVLHFLDSLSRRILSDELHVRSAAPNLGSEPDHIAVDGGDHVDHRSGDCSSSCSVGCLSHPVSGSRAWGRTVGHPATTCHQPASIRALGAERPRPRAAQEVLSPGTARRAGARIALALLRLITGTGMTAREPVTAILLCPNPLPPPASPGHRPGSSS